MKLKIHTYPNGARLIYGYDKRWSVTSCHVKFYIGSMYEKKPGACHFFEHMVFKSTLTKSIEQRQELFKKIGAAYNGYTSDKRVRFDYSSLNEFFEEGFAEYISGFTQPKLDKQEIQREKDVILQEYHRALSNTTGLLTRAANLVLLKGRRYNPALVQNLGTPSSIKSMTKKDLEQVMQMLTPDKLVVFAYGGLKYQKIKKILEKNMQKYLLRDDFVSAHVPEFEYIEKPKFFTLDAKKPQAMVLIKQRTFGVLDDRRFALAYLGYALNGLKGRLFSEIREKRGLVYNINVNWGASKDGGEFFIDFGTSKEKVSEVLKLIKLQLKEIAQNGLSDSEFQGFKIRSKSDMFWKHIDVSTLVKSAEAEMREFGRLISDKERRQKIENVTNEDVKAVAKYLLENKSYVIVASDKRIKKSELHAYEKA